MIDLLFGILIGLTVYPIGQWLFSKWLDRPRPFRIDRDFRNPCRDCTIGRAS